LIKQIYVFPVKSLPDIEYFCTAKKRKMGYGKEFERYLRPTYYVDSDNPDVIAFAKKHTESAVTDKEKAVKLYYAVRDGFRYDPYHVDLRPEELKASTLLHRGSGYCVEKANLLGAAARAVGIPSRFAFFNVRNHLSTEKLIRALRSDIFVFHGLTELYIDGKWVKATPAFNIELCQKFHVPPLEFDGEHDSMFQEYDSEHHRFMDYLHDYGTFDDIPRDLFLQSLQKYYPHLFKEGEEEMVKWE